LEMIPLQIISIVSLVSDSDEAEDGERHIPTARSPTPSADSSCELLIGRRPEPTKGGKDPPKPCLRRTPEEETK